MTLEEFAAAALQGMLAHPKRYNPRYEDRELSWHEAIAKEAFEIAAAMQKEQLKAILEENAE